jgi:pimeloyl-ACP methyl ester carboxylesterase
MELPQLDARRHTVQTRSGKISYIDTGAGPVALFVHGIAANALLWRNVIEALESRRRCIALDLPLHGQSPVSADQDMSIAAMASLVEDFCDALGLDRVDLVANDVGGAIAQVVAARSP